MYAASVPTVSDLHPLAPFILGTAGAVISTVAFLLATNAVRCPKCQLRLLPWAMANRPVRDWLQWLYRVQECPRCNHHAS